MLVKLYLICLPIFLLIDAVWLTQIAPSFYQKQIGFLLTENPNLIAAGIFYLLFVLGLVVFVIEPSIKSKSNKKALFMGGLFGLIAYATYDLTNLATIENWPIIVTIVDMIWGTVLGATTSYITYLVYKKLRKK